MDELREDKIFHEVCTVASGKPSAENSVKALTSWEEKRVRCSDLVLKTVVGWARNPPPYVFNCLGLSSRLENPIEKARHVRVEDKFPIEQGVTGRVSLPSMKMLSTLTGNFHVEEILHFFSQT